MKSNINRMSRLTAAIMATPLAMAVVPNLAQAAGALEEIVVTAQRREESLQEVPIAINAFSENFLEEAGVTSSLDLNMVTPGLNFGAQLNGATPFIRGIGNNGTTVGQDASVATFVDDVYMSASAGSILSLNNIERIEILKGPQGTLFGRNATGGLIHIITKSPQQETSGKLDVSLGNYDTTTVSFYGTTGLTDNIAGDISIYHNNQDDGWGTNLATGNDVYEGKETIIRSKLLIEATENTTITLGADYTDTEGSKGVAMNIAEGSLGIDGLLTFGALLEQGLSPEEAGPIAYGAATKPTDNFYDNNSVIDPIDKAENWGVFAKIVHQMGDMELTSITAYRDFEHEYHFDQFATPNPLAEVFMPEYTETFTQELRLSSSTDKLNWIVGAYFLEEDAGFDPPFIARGPLIQGELQVLSEQSTSSWAVFAQGTYALTDATNLTLGARYTEDKRELDGTTSFYVGDFLAVFNEFSDDETFSEPTWRISLDHQFTDSFMGYVSYNRGFKSGVYATVVTDFAGPRPPVEPEILDAYEIGFKSDLLDDRLRVNGAAYYYEFDNLQATISEAGTAYLINAAEATVSGGELEMLAALSDNLQVNAGISVIDAEYDSFPDGAFFMPSGVGGNLLTTADLSGNKVVRSPDYTLNAGFTLDVPTDNGMLTVSLNYYYNDGFYWEQDNRTEQESYSLVNGKVTWTHPSEAFYVQLWGNNLADVEYTQFSISSEPGDLRVVAAPRTYGLKVGYEF